MTAKSKRKQSPPVDKRLAKSIAHGTRIDILRILNERVASPKELAQAVNDGLSQVSYHVSELLAYGNIELVKTEPRRGAVEHYYRAVTPPLVTDAEAKKMTRKAREEISTVMLQSVIGEAAAALRAGSFDSHFDRHLSWVPMTLDQKGWDEMTALLAETLESAQEIKERNSARIADSAKSGTEVIVSLMGFERSKSRAA